MAVLKLRVAQAEWRRAASPVGGQPVGFVGLEGGSEAGDGDGEGEGRRAGCGGGGERAGERAAGDGLVARGFRGDAEGRGCAGGDVGCGHVDGDGSVGVDLDVRAQIGAGWGIGDADDSELCLPRSKGNSRPIPPTYPTGLPRRNVPHSTVRKEPCVALSSASRIGGRLSRRICQSIEDSTKIAMRRMERFCSYNRVWSPVTKTSTPSSSATFNSAPFFSPAQPLYLTVNTSCSPRWFRNRCGRFSSSNTFN